MPLEKLNDFSVSYLQILDEEGTVDKKLVPKLSNDQLIELYRYMSLAREADQRMLIMQRQGRIGTLPLCTGQEAVACASAYAMEKDDWYCGYYRELGGRLVRGQPLREYFQYWNGLEEGNLWPGEPRRTLPVAAVIGTQTLHAVGIAYAEKLKGKKTAAVTYFGEGATSEGDVHEAMNFAAVWDAPVVFICINNQYAISVPREIQTRSSTIAQKAISYGFEGIQVDGNDPLSVYRATKAALDRARDGGGPTLIEAMTYRLLMHTTADDPKKYRNDSEVDAWWKKDPLPRMRKYLESRKLWNAKKQEAMEVELKAEVDESARAFTDVSFKPDAPFDHVYETPPASLERQRRAFLEELELDRAAGVATTHASNG